MCGYNRLWQTAASIAKMDDAMTKIKATSYISLFTCEEGFGQIEDQLHPNTCCRTEAMFEEDWTAFLAICGKVDRPRAAKVALFKGSISRNCSTTLGAR